MRGKIERLIRGFVEGYPDLNQTRTDWDTPLVGFASAADPLCENLKGWVSDTHLLPKDLLPNAQTVITYFIPFKKEMAFSNRGGEKASSEWAKAYIETNKLIVDLNHFLGESLQKDHFQATLVPPTHNFDEQRLISEWSHKHLAWIAGLGRFGLHRMLITEKGCCGRLGSLVTDASIEPSRRPEKEFCLFHYDQSCKKCVDHCTFEALKIDSYDRHRCYEICLINAKEHSNSGYADVCGKCMAAVPCSFKNPVK